MGQTPDVIEKNLEKLQSYDIEMIAPSHGPIYPRPSFIIEAYREWVLGPPKNTVVLPYVSMHKSTKQMVPYLVEVLAGMIPNLKVEVLEPVLSKGLPEAEDFNALEKPAETVTRKHNEQGFR